MSVHLGEGGKGDLCAPKHKTPKPAGLGEGQVVSWKQAGRWRIWGVGCSLSFHILVSAVWAALGQGRVPPFTTLSLLLVQGGAHCMRSAIDSWADG